MQVDKSQLQHLVGVSKQFVILDDVGDYVKAIRATIGTLKKMNNEFKDGLFYYAKPHTMYHEKFEKNKVDNVPIILITIDGADSYVQGLFKVVNQNDTHIVLKHHANVSIPTSSQTSLRYNSTTFRSQLEIKLQRFFDFLGIEAKYEAIVLKYDHHKSYTVDFYLPSMGEFVELKPTYPTEQEIMLCERVSRQGLPILLLYGEIKPARYESKENEPYSHRPHATGLRGIRWSRDGIICESDLIPMYDDVKGLIFDQCKSSDDKRWRHPKLMSAYASIEGSTPRRLVSSSS